MFLAAFEAERESTLKNKAVAMALKKVLHSFFYPQMNVDTS